jgi:hypothetical protein
VGRLKLLTAFLFVFSGKKQFSTEWEVMPIVQEISTLRLSLAKAKAWGLLSLPAGRQGLILSGASISTLKSGGWRRRSIRLLKHRSPDQEFKRCLAKGG